jgi:DNA-directed RNA polymerase subunit omega
MISAGVDSKDLAKRGESLIRQSTNRYLTTVKIAFRAKQRRFDDFDGLLEESSVPSLSSPMSKISLISYLDDSTGGAWLAPRL